MVATRLALVSLLGFILLADSAVLAGTAEAGGSVPLPAAAPSPSPVAVAPQSAAAFDPWQKGTSSIAFNLGLGSAVGALGLTYSYLPWPGLETEAGIGLGFTGLQLSAMQKFVLGKGRTRFVAGVGVGFSSGAGDAGSKSSNLWLNVDALGLEVRTKSGLVFFLSVGITHAFGAEIDFILQSVGDTFPQLRIGFGKAF
jgi:hypothetical protein